MEDVGAATDSVKGRSAKVDDQFTTDTAGLSDASPSRVIRLHDGGRFDLSIEPVRKRVDEAELRMLGYNGSIPGPTLHVHQGSEITVQVTNDGDVEATVHWHGLRLENRYDGVPHETQAPIPVGGTFTYKVQFPDAGFYWYHPHVREDFGLEMGLYGTIVVEPTDPSYWPAVDRQLTLTLDDLLVEDGHIAPFHRSGPTFVAMGRFGNVMLTNGQTEFSGEAAVGGFSVTGTAAGKAAESFEVLRTDPDLTAEHQSIGHDLERPPDKVLAFFSLMPLLYGADDTPAPAYACPMHPEVTATEPGTCPKCGMKLVPSDAPPVPTAEPHHDVAHGHDHGDGLEWEDLMPEINRASDSSNMIWQLIDRQTGAVNGAISWAFTVGDRVKIRLVNELDADHPMHHPFHIHGAGRFLVLARDSEPESNLVWKDTVLLRSGQTVDILLDVSNPGLWMAHCHIAEHNQSGMMFSFNVARREPASGSADTSGRLA